MYPEDVSDVTEFITSVTIGAGSGYNNVMVRSIVSNYFASIFNGILFQTDIIMFLLKGKPNVSSEKALEYIQGPHADSNDKILDGLNTVIPEKEAGEVKSMFMRLVNEIRHSKNPELILVND